MLCYKMWGERYLGVCTAYGTISSKCAEDFSNLPDLLMFGLCCLRSVSKGRSGVSCVSKVHSSSSANFAFMFSRMSFWQVRGAIATASEKRKSNYNLVRVGLKISAFPLYKYPAIQVLCCWCLIEIIFNNTPTLKRNYFHDLVCIAGSCD
jgi:hypothetical protein